jgi:AraC family transcriptional regulator
MTSKPYKTVMPRIELLNEKKLVGNRMRMTLTDNKTGELWKNFMQRRKEIKNKLNDLLFSMQVYEQLSYFEYFNPETPFEKWAAVEVQAFNSIPAEMETYLLPAGLYAVFVHRGGSATADGTFRYIFGTWLPDSEYELDNRPHFELLGEKYKNDDPDSEEEIWIPIKSLFLPGN